MYQEDNYKQGKNHYCILKAFIHSHHLILIPFFLKNN